MKGGDPISEKTTYQIEMDTKEAQKNVEELDESTQKLSERMKNLGAAGAGIGDGIAGGIGQGMSALDNLGGSMEVIGSAAAAAGNAGAAAGAQIGAAFETAADGIGKGQSALEDYGGTTDAATQAAARLSTGGTEAGEKIKQAFKNAASESDNLGTSFAKNYSKAIQAGDGFAKSIKTGIVGAVDTAKKKTDSFIKDTVGGAKKMGDAFLHPIKTMKDSFTSAMKDATKSVSELSDEAEKSQKNLDNMGKSGQDAGSKMKSGLSSALAVLGAIAIAAASITGLTKFVTSAAEASQSAQVIQYSFEQAFGESSVDVEAWANNFSNAVHRSNSEVKGFLTTNQMLFEGLGVTGKEAEALSKATTSLAYDLGNFTGLDDAQALQKVQNAIKGNNTALSEYGVTLDDNRLKQTAINMGLSDNLKDLDDATIAQIRFNAILEQTTGMQGAAASSLGGLNGGIKAMRAAWTDFMEKAGAKLAPLFDKIFGAILDAWPQIEPALMDFVDLLASGFENAIPVIAELATSLLPDLLGLAGDLLPILANIGGEILPVLASAFSVALTAIQPVLPVIANLAKDLLPPLATIINTLVTTLLPPLSKLFEAISPILKAVAPALDLVASAVSFVSDAISTLIGWLTSAIEKVAEFGQKIANSPVGKFIGGAGSAIGGFFSSNAKGTDNFEGGWTHIHEAGKEIIENKQESGIAYLPKGSTIIPASKTEQILSEAAGQSVVNITNLLPQSKQQSDPQGIINPQQILKGVTDWVPTLFENKELLNKRALPIDEEPQDKKRTWENDPDGPEQDPPPSIYPPFADEPAETRKVIEINLNVTVSSPDGTVPNEVIDKIRDVAKEAAKEAYREIEGDKYSDLSIQNGFAG